MEPALLCFKCVCFAMRYAHPLYHGNVKFSFHIQDFPRCVLINQVVLDNSYLIAQLRNTVVTKMGFQSQMMEFVQSCSVQVCRLNYSLIYLS